MRYIPFFLLALFVASMMPDKALADQTIGATASAAAARYEAVMPVDVYDDSLPKTSQVLMEAGFDAAAMVEDYLNGLKDLKPAIAFGYVDKQPEGSLPLAMAFKEIITSRPQGTYDRISLLAIEITDENRSELVKIGCHAVPCLAYHAIVGRKVYHRVNIGGPGSQTELNRMVEEWRTMMDFMRNY